MSTTDVGRPGFRVGPIRYGKGHPLPLGASRRSASEVNFVLISRHATAVTLVLSDVDPAGEHLDITLDPAHHRTGNHWHVGVNGLPEEFTYGYRVDGPKGPMHRFNPDIVLLDPVCPTMTPSLPWGQADGPRRRSLMTGPPATRLDDDYHPKIRRSDTILYELNVRGFTVDPSSGVDHPGTFAGLAERAGYLQELGVTALELLPIDEFDENDCPYADPVTGEQHRNLWGYNAISYAAIKASYASERAGAAPREEFRRMVACLHDSGIEVILDVVFNHTAEGGDEPWKPTYSYRGIDNSLYYMIDEAGKYLNFTGCGNSVNGNHPIVRSMILNCLREAVAGSGVDGFRFDLASVLGRDRRGNVLLEPPVIEEITDDSLLAGSKMIAEPWDAAGLYQVGSFPGGHRWAIWNGRYRDDVRRFWRGEPGMVPALATRLCGSDDVGLGRGPLHSINFVTCHDGFTLNDMVSYNDKHNVANGEGNRDGSDQNFSWNCGAEGPTDDPGVLALRARQARNLMATLLVSQGVPMILGGDEFLRTQRGNNNAWCQDNAISHVDWTLAEKNADFLRFVKLVIALRKRHHVLKRRTFFDDQGSITWHGSEPFEPDFSGQSHAIAFMLDGRLGDRPEVDRDLYVVMNAHWEPRGFVIPESPSGRRWRLAVDTSKVSPEDAFEPDQGPMVPVLHRYPVEARSMVILVSEG